MSPEKLRVNFVDERLESLVAENAVLHSKLQSKIEALSIMTKQLDKCRVEKDHYKLLAEQFHMRYPLTRKNELDPKYFFEDFCIPNKFFDAQLLMETKKINKLLTIEVENLKQKLEEAEEDIKAIRRGNCVQKSCNKNFEIDVITTFNLEREELVHQLEITNKKVEQLQNDLKSILDEKEDLINERDAYKCKLHRLNHELTVALTKNKNINTEKPELLLDIDGLVMENRYLQERLTQAQAEKELVNNALTKYKNILETKQQKGSLKLGTTNGSAVVSHKQVKQLLESGTTHELPITAATIADLRALSFGLLDALNDKSLALSHQRRANRILATRIMELEKKIESGSSSQEGISVFPSKVLLESYCSSNVDQYKIDSLNSQSNDNQNLDENMYKNQYKLNANNVIEDYTLNCNNSLSPQLQKLVEEALENLHIGQ